MGRKERRQKGNVTARLDYAKGKAKFVKCDECNGLINYSNIQLNDKFVKMTDGVRLTLRYFKCEHCGKIYRISWMTDELSEAIDRYKVESHYLKCYIDEKREEGVTEKELKEMGDEKYKLRFDRVDKLSSLVKKKSDNLNRIYDSRIPNLTATLNN